MTHSDAPSLKIGRILVDSTSPPFVIAEVGVNHNGSVDVAHELIDVAASAGVQAVKFQIFSARRLAHVSAPSVEYQRRSGGEATQRELLQSLELPASSWSELRDHARSADICFLATAFDRDSLTLLLTLEPAALKIGSGDLANRRLLEEAASTGLPIIASTGLSTMSEVDRTVSLFRMLGVEFALLHCVTSYPAPIGEANLRAIPVLGKRHHVIVGWSDHTLGLRSAVLARALGAKVFERHFTLDKELPGPDHKASSNPQELAAYVSALHEVDLALGDGVKKVMPAEEPLRLAVRRSHYATRDIVRGEVLSEDDTELLRPEVGIDAFESLAGRVALKDVATGDPITADDIQ